MEEWINSELTKYDSDNINDSNLIYNKHEKLKKYGISRYDFLVLFKSHVELVKRRLIGYINLYLCIPKDFMN